MDFSIEFLLLSTVSLFTIVNPFSAVPAFLAITPGETVKERRVAARMACIIGTVLLMLTALAGEFVFRMLGITLPSLQIAGGIILFSIGFEMVRAPDAPKRLNDSEREAAREKEDIAVTPLAVPLLCGPGSVSTVIILQSQTSSLWETGMLLVSIPVVYLASYLILSASAKGGEWLNPILLRILRRVMGLLFAVIAVQFVVNGISNLPFVESRVEPVAAEEAG